MTKDGQKILIVDDNRFFAIRLRQLLHESGTSEDISLVDNYEDALSHLTKHKPEIVLLDVHLRNKNGIDLLKLIHLSGWACKVVMLTNETKSAYRIQCEKFGSSAFLDKSNDFEEIPELIKEL